MAFTVQQNIESMWGRDFCCVVIDLHGINTAFRSRFVLKFVEMMRCHVANSTPGKYSVHQCLILLGRYWLIFLLLSFLLGGGADNEKNNIFIINFLFFCEKLKYMEKVANTPLRLTAF